MNNNLKIWLSEKLAKILKTDTDTVKKLITVPPNIKMGDYALPCFTFAKSLKKSPQKIADELKEYLTSQTDKHSIITEFKAISGFLNIFVDREKEAKTIVENICEYKNQFGKSKLGQGKTIVVDYSSPNIAKPIALHHLRSTMIGNAICNILEFTSHKVIRINYLGDWGTNFGKLLIAFEKWSNKDNFNKEGVEHLVKLYQKFEREKESDPSLEDSARNAFKRIETGDKKALAIWKEFRDVAISEFKKIYTRLNVHFDFYEGEASVNEKIPNLIAELKSKIGLKESEGAEIIELSDETLPPVLIRKSDGTTLYATRDIAEAIKRKEKYKFYKNIYVVDVHQRNHFKSVFGVLSLLGYEWQKDCEHIPFGLMMFNDKKMATRTGNMIYLSDVLDKAQNLALDIINQKNPTLESKEEVSEKVGLGAIIFNDLKNKRIKNVNFNWNDALNFDGETGPYVQYTYARITSIFRKAQVKVSKVLTEKNSFHPEKVNSEEEITIIKSLMQFSNKIEEAALEYEPSLIAKYVLDLCSNLNSFYNKHPVISDDKELMSSRLLLIACTRQVIENCANLLALPLIERM